MGTWPRASKTTNNAAGRRDVLLAPGAAGGPDTSVRPHPHTRANPGSQQPKARIIISIPQMTKLRSRQDAVFAPRHGTESDLPFLRRPFRTCPGGLSPGPVLQDRLSRTDSPGAGSILEARSLLFTAFPTLLVTIPRDLLPYISLVFSFQR